MCPLSSHSTEAEIIIISEVQVQVLVLDLSGPTLLQFGLEHFWTGLGP